MYGFVYITTNNLNGMKYIGQRKYDPDEKWKTYLGSGVYLRRAIEKYGKENFTKEIIEECESKELLNEREKYWIQFYNAINSEKFYNLASGGDGGNTICGYSEEQLAEYKKFKQELHKKTALKGEMAPMSKLSEKEVKEIIRLLLKNTYTCDIANMYMVGTSTIDDIYFHRTWAELTKGIVFPSRENNIPRKRGQKRVIQYDLNLNYIAEYESAHEAERQTGIGFRMICRVCKGDRPYTHGYIFKYVD